MHFRCLSNHFLLNFGFLRPPFGVHVRSQIAFKIDFDFNYDSDTFFSQISVSRRRPETLKNTIFFVESTTLFAYSAFFVLGASWNDFGSILAPFWLLCWLFVNTFFVKNACQNRLQILMRFWSPFCRHLAPTWLPFGSQHGVPQGSRRGHAPCFFGFRRPCYSKSLSGPRSDPFLKDLGSILAL